MESFHSRLTNNIQEVNLWSNLANEVSRGVDRAYEDQRRNRKDAFVEIEIQFGTYIPPKESQRYGKFKSLVSPSSFNRVKNKMLQSNARRIDEQIIEDHIDGDERRALNKTTNEITYYDKIKIWSTYVFYDPREKRTNSRISNNGRYFAEELNSRINVSNEYIYPNTSKNFSPKTIRNKNRISFIFDKIGKLDLTQATETSVDEKSSETRHSFDTTYEIELEMTLKDFIQNTQRIKEFCEDIYSLLQDSEIPYTNTQKSNMYRYVSGILHIDSGILKYNLLPEARDLKIEDMVHGGVVGNPQTQYTVTHKADGIRRLLVFMPNEVWMFMPGLPDANLLYRNENIEQMHGFVFDGELLTKENRRDTQSSKYMYYIFDCLCENNNDIRHVKDYHKRIEYALNFTRKRKESYHLNQIIQLRIKHSKDITSVDNFFEVMNTMFEEQKLLNYNQDGFMFIPIHSEYNPYEESKLNKSTPPIYSRCLSQHSDICKWKPKEMRSIDFLVEIRQNTPTEKKIILNALDIDPSTNQRRMRAFTGTKSYPLMDRIDIHHPILQSLLNKSIVEFYWDEDKNILTPIRIRTDKVSPNRYFSALNIWKGIFSGIEPDTLRGQTFQLMRAYHNQIKLNLYHHTCPTKNHKVLLDIGSGRGGDIKKWKDFELVFAVEPNPQHIKELETRLESSPMKHKVIIIPTGGEDHETITNTIQNRYGERVSTVSLMLSFSFFDGVMREGLRRTIEQNLELGGEVLVFTINGDEVQKTFSESCKDEQCLKLLNAEMKYEPSIGKLWIHIPSTIVNHQEEVPPKLNQLFGEWNNFLPMNLSSANEQQFMNRDEKRFSHMFSSFKLKFMTDNINDIEIEKVIPYTKIDGKDWYTITVHQSPYFFLSAVLKAMDTQYQNDKHSSFRRSYEEKVWEEIQKFMSEEEKLKYTSIQEQEILELLSDIYDVSILYIHNQEHKIYGKSNNKIIINHHSIMGMMNDKGLLQTIF